MMSLFLSLLYISFILSAVSAYCEFEEEDGFREQLLRKQQRDVLPARYQTVGKEVDEQLSELASDSSMMMSADGKKNTSLPDTNDGNTADPSRRFATYYQPLNPQPITPIIQPYYVMYPPNNMALNQQQQQLGFANHENSEYIPIGPVSEVAPELYVHANEHDSAHHGDVTHHHHHHHQHVHHHVHHLHGHTKHIYEHYYDNETSKERVNHYVETLHPCENGGIIIPHTHSGFQCICKKKFLGSHCEDLNYCSTCPCGKNGRCNPVDYYPGYTCTCKKEFFGKHCEKPNPCEPNMCQNGGSCTHDGKNHTQCICREGYRGLFCEEINGCIPSPCKNGGTCSHVTGKNGSFVCECPDQFKGLLCQYPTFCQSRPCQNGGTCRETDDDFSCICKVPYIGKTCRDRPCDPNPCYFGSTCVENGTDYSCICSPWASGRNCRDLSVCRLNPCRSNGQCIDANSGFRWGFKQMQYYCLCRPPYMGPHCTDNICNHCSPYGHCNNDSRCICDEGYFGNGFICEPEEPDPCHPNPCKNYGVCVKENGNSYHCKCKPPYLPPLCMTVDPCNPDPCVNGRCFPNADNSWYCKCHDFYHGAHCNVTDVCTPNPCQNNGLCNKTKNGTVATCECLGEWSGEVCKHCNCPASATPDETPGTYCDVNGKCQCYKWGPWSWEFKNGQCVNSTTGGGETIDACTDNLCKHGATCRLISTTATPRTTMSTTTPNINSRKRRQLPHKVSPPITPGPITTQSKIGSPNLLGYICECSRWFYGPLCGNLRWCIPLNPCHNGGTCQEVADLAVNFTCICPPHTTGKRCDAIPTPPPKTPVGPCHPNPCKNNGTCQALKEGYDCQCDERYTGSDCGIDKCKDCDPNAVCLHGHCVCIVGFVGNGYDCVEEGKPPPCGQCPKYSVCLNNNCACLPGYIYTHKICIPLNNEEEDIETDHEVFPTPHHTTRQPQHTTRKPDMFPTTKQKLSTTRQRPSVTVMPPTPKPSTTRTISKTSATSAAPSSPEPLSTSPLPPVSTTGGGPSTPVGPPGTLPTTGPPGPPQNAPTTVTPPPIMGPPASSPGNGPPGSIRGLIKEYLNEEKHEKSLHKNFDYLKLPDDVSKDVKHKSSEQNSQFMKKNTTLKDNLKAADNKTISSKPKSHTFKSRSEKHRRRDYRPIKTHIAKKRRL